MKLLVNPNVALEKKHQNSPNTPEKNPTTKRTTCFIKH